MSVPAGGRPAAGSPAARLPAGWSSAEDDRLRRIEAVTDAALARLPVEDLLDELLDRVSELLGADTAAVLLLDPSSRQLVATAARGLEAEVRQGVRIPVGRGFAGRIAAEQRPVILEHVDHTNVLNPILRDTGIRSLLGVPLVANGRVIGVLHVGTLTSRVFTEDDTALLQMVADRVALAIRARQSEVERASASTLQRSLPPATLPAIPGFDLAARYVPGEEGGVGGDWHDVFMLHSGQCGLVIGDVAGRGLHAAIVMSRLRSVLRAYSLVEADPAAILHRMDVNVERFEPDVMATVLCGLFEPSLDRLVVSSAGHFPPVLAVPGRPPVVVDLPIDPPLGVHDVPTRRTATIDLPPGAVLCFYTDGLVERRHLSLEAGIERLRQVVRPDPAEDVCGDVMARMVGNEPSGDDIAVLVVRRRDGDESGDG